MGGVEPMVRAAGFVVSVEMRGLKDWVTCGNMLRRRHADVGLDEMLGSACELGVLRGGRLTAVTTCRKRPRTSYSKGSYATSRGPRPSRPDKGARHREHREVGPDWCEMLPCGRR